MTENETSLAKRWSEWLVALQVGDADWKRYAINQLRIAVERCETEEGTPLAQAGGILDIA
jgi:hypothetical protein